MSDNYAMIAQLIEDKDLCVMVAEMVRFNARIYPSATPLQVLPAARPTALTPEVIEQTWQSMQGKPEYADIEELTNNQNERFLFSTKHLTRRYAKAISDVDEWSATKASHTIESGYKSFFEQRCLNSHKEHDTAPQC